jgi:hypothetical protein
MTRPTTSGLPFLVCRSDSGKFAYWRNLPADIARFVTGEVALAWTPVPHRLESRAVVKISLKTGDQLTARRRWGEVHSQIEGLIEKANAAAKSQRPQNVTTLNLTSGDRVIIAAQARHDVLADHDGGWTDPSQMTALARGFEQALLRSGAGNGLTSNVPTCPPCFLRREFAKPRAPWMRILYRECWPAAARGTSTD